MDVFGFINPVSAWCAGTIFAWQNVNVLTAAFSVLPVFDVRA